MQVDEAEQEGDEAAEAANEAEEKQPEQTSEDYQHLLDYCLSVEEDNRYLISMQGQLPSMTDLVLPIFEHTPWICQ